jgi:hypothetical protein
VKCITLYFLIRVITKLPNSEQSYKLNSMVMDSLYKNIIKPMNDYIIPIELDRSLDICQQIYINGPATKTVNTGPAHTVYNTDDRGLTKTEYQY